MNEARQDYAAHEVQQWIRCKQQRKFTANKIITPKPKSTWDTHSTFPILKLQHPARHVKVTITITESA